MGCVLGTRAAAERGARRKKKNEQVQNSESVPDRKEMKIEEAAVPPPEFRRPEFRLKRGVSAGAEEWPSWLIDIAGQAIKDWKPRRANTFEKLLKIGQGTYSNVYKARDLVSGKIVALKKVRFNNLEPEAVRFMAREILVLRRLDHPNVIKLEGVAISRMSSSLYLVFEYMDHDLAGLAAAQTAKFTLAQVKCYMKQLLSGLEHCHSNGVLHRDIKSSNLLINNEGILRIADFGLASFFDSECRRPMTSRVVTLWYRPPELLLGSTHYGVGVDLWSSGCILAELFAGKPILRGRTEVEQVHKIFKLCGSPSEEYWKKSRFPNVTLYKPHQPYSRCIAEAFKDFPPSSLPLLETLLAIYPDARGTATSALDGEFFTTEPYACEPSSLPKFPPSKEMDIKLRDEAARRQRGSGAKLHVVDGNGRARVRNKLNRAVPAPEANAELRFNLDRLSDAAKRKSKSGKFPPPHEDAGVGHPHNASRNGAVSFGWGDTSFNSSIFDRRSSQSLRSTSPKSVGSRKEEPRRARFTSGLDPSTIGWGLGFRRRRTVSENFSHQL